MQPAVLTIAGSDSSGGAGIQADLKTFAAHGCYGTSAITALTAQNTTGVQDVFPSSPEFVEKQIKSIVDDIHITAIKTGMLFDTENCRAVVRALKQYYHHSSISSTPDSSRILSPIICDPVCVSTSGHTLLHPSAVDVMINELFPISTLITPNTQEAGLILSQKNLGSGKIDSLESMLLATKNLMVLSSEAVLLKGGHVTAKMADVEGLFSKYGDSGGIRIIRDGLLGENMEILQARKDKDASSSSVDCDLVVDILMEKQGQTTVFVRPRIESSSTHGTGCTLSAAIAANLALGNTLVDAVRAATVYTHVGIETATLIGHGHGPLNHLHSTNRACIPRRTRSNPYPFVSLLIQRTKDIWKAYVEHDFVKQLGRGTLKEECFVHFLKQDYHYLKYYARAYALLAAKSPSFTSIDSAVRTITNILQEINTHKAFCAQFGVSEEELEQTEESRATTAYGAWLIDMGVQGDTTKLLIALLACLLGYGEVGLWLKKQVLQHDSGIVLEGNKYLRWIEDYSGEGYQGAVSIGLEIIEERAAADPPSPARFEEWCEVWKRCTTLEKRFWDMGLELEY
ncbi:trifunctional hydroxymethylpyrimidine kinase/phosphomethylpyrimidine kinase/thiaminase [Stygiomarasmius scandens]|uniref:Trifunctional hydroxymethylpyrimidine kinase/phosphomethylpyrimidine kinase/thiaminase n=1 Tax=Marasmiellus scandens TaxID=2682957 RepID=A0ABR1IRY9_9AGAR